MLLVVDVPCAVGVAARTVARGARLGRGLGCGGIDEPYIRPARRDGRTIAPIRIPRGRYFMMDDNRISSCDSRMWGTVPRASLIGKVVATYWPPLRLGFRPLTRPT